MSAPFAGRYTPLGEPKTGGTGYIVMCQDEDLDRRVAIKFLGSYRDKKRIYAEISALQRVRSKNVVEIYDVLVQQPGNTIGVIEEYLSGSGLDELAPIPPERLLGIAYQIANGVEDIHAANLVHRDLKPNNMRMTSEEIVKIFDFDLARDEDDAQTVGFKGTKGYAAPELYNFNAHFDRSADVYSFGVSVLALACNELPASLAAQPPDPARWVAADGFSRAVPQLPSPVASMLDRCLSPQPAARPTASSIRTEIARHLVQGRHRASIVYGGSTHVCDTSRPTLRLSISGRGGLEIVYDGLRFVASQVEGSVFVNNAPLTARQSIDGSCVLTFGDRSLAPYERVFIPFDVAEPEVVL